MKRIILLTILAFTIAMPLKGAQLEIPVKTVCLISPSGSSQAGIFSRLICHRRLILGVCERNILPTR